MKNLSITSLVSTIVITTGLTVVSSTFYQANAYSVTNKGSIVGVGISGNELYDVSVNSQNDIGRKLDPVKWLVPAGTSNGTDTTPIALSAMLEITIKELTANSATLGMKITNTTTVPSGYGRADVTSFGFGVKQTVNRASISNSNTINQQETNVFTKTPTSGFNAGGFNNRGIDICIFAGRNCSGGGKDGLNPGKFDVFDLIISGSFYNSSLKYSEITLSDFPMKFQTENGSYEPAGVPEPLTVIGSGLALGFGALFKKQVAKKRSKTGIKA